MKYCVPYKRNFKYIDEIDELDIRYKKEDTKLLEFLKKFGENKRINIQINYDELESNLEFFKALRKNYPKIDFALVISSPYWKNYSHVHQKLGEYDIKFFFIHEINNWDELHGYLNLDPCPCDVIITEDLCFQLKDVAELVHSKGVRIRTYANVGQSTWNDTPALKKFFIETGITQCCYAVETENGNKKYASRWRNNVFGRLDLCMVVHILVPRDAVKITYM